MKNLFLKKEKVKENRIVPNTPVFICIIGIDGSGKTTLARRLIDSFSSKSIKYYYLWGGIDKLIFLSPLRTFLYKIFLDKKRNNRVKKENIEDKKNSLRYKYPKLIRVYYFLMKIDYVLCITIRMIYFRILRRSFICDRYIYDVGINIALVQNMSELSIYSFINNCLKFLPKPDILIWLDAPVKTAFSRKDDAISIEYLLKRQKIYKEVAKRHSAVRLDGTKPIKDLEVEIFYHLLSLKV
jgi:thymidylate kinase